MKKLNQKGFTLLELLAVLVILAALATIAIPIFMNKGAEARLQANKSNLREIINAVQRYEWDNGTPDPTVGAESDTYYTILTDAHPIVDDGLLTTAPVSPYKNVTNYKNFVYCIGRDGTSGNTIVKLVAVDAGVDGVTDADAAPARTTLLNVGDGVDEGKFLTNTKVYEVTEDATTTTDLSDVKHTVIS
ncbi:MAG: hypothetical protein A2Y22_04685 [Clostridiales bacterium GWD2_32_59]|nr:MAG: hypothetical protein A2Y22_04685 [Clostridiales bacterium GWD2_32_59]